MCIPIKSVRKGGCRLLTEIRWHGRGGQGIVTISRLLAEAALTEGKHVQSFPEFGPERTGAPIKGFTRIGDEPIDIHSQVYTPDIVVVLDPTLLKNIDVTEGLVKGGKILLNTEKSPEEMKKELKIENAKVYTVNARRIALDLLGRPIYNTAMLGALIRVSNLTSLDSVKEVTRKRFKGSIAEKNVKVIERAYKEVSSG